jgi:cysteine-rich repeat protein
MLQSSGLVVLSLLCSFALAAPAFAKVTPEQKCASSQMKAVGKKLAAEAKCYAKALAASAVVDPTCLSAAATKFAEAFIKADTGDCLHVSDSGPIATKIHEAIDDIVGDIGCGDGAQQGDEQCDDGNLIETDGCSTTCIASTCGDGVIAGAEECDDDGVSSGDGCSATCLEEPGYHCTGAPSVCSSVSTVCGDGFVSGTEACDDMNVAGGDGCSSTCSVESGFVCTGEPSVCLEDCSADYSPCAVDADCCTDGALCLGPGFCLPPP